jgi:DNA-binding MarR family transcriptional regulator
MAETRVHSQAAEVISRECLATRMRRLNRLVSGIYDRSFRTIRATASQMSILVVLARANGAKPAEVCSALQMDKSTLCRNVQRLLAQGWVETKAIDDARSHRLALTDAGRGLIEQALPLWRGAQAQAREALGGAVADRLFEAVDAPFSGNSLGAGGPVSSDKIGPGRPKSTIRGQKPPFVASSNPETADSGGEKSREIFFWE